MLIYSLHRQWQYFSMIQVYYRFNNLSLLREPLMLVSGFFLLFVAYIVFVHVDMSISKSSASYISKLQWDEVCEFTHHLLYHLNRLARHLKWSLDLLNSNVLLVYNLLYVAWAPFFFLPLMVSTLLFFLHDSDGQYLMPSVFWWTPG